MTCLRQQLFFRILLALILGPMAESNLRRTLVISQGDPSVILHQPIAMFLLILAVLSLVMSYRSQRKVAARMLAAKKADEDSKL